MGRPSRSIPMELVEKAVGPELAKRKHISAREVGMLIGRSEKQLYADRQLGKPPPFRELNGSIKYPIKEFEEWLDSQPLHNKVVPKADVGDIRKFGSFSAFLDRAALQDEWPFAIVSGKPIDFLASLAQEPSEETQYRWLTLLDYLNERKAWAERQPRLAEEKNLRRGTKAELGKPGKGKPPL